MKKKKYKWLLIMLGAILLILIITNPSTSRFKEYLYSQGYLREGKTYNNLSYGKENNYFIFSYFKYNKGEIHSNYFGIFGNFYKIVNSKEKEEKKQKDQQDSITKINDSLANAKQHDYIMSTQRRDTLKIVK